MPINFIPNDPLALSSMPLRSITAHPNRPSGRAGFTFVNQVSQANYDPGTPEFLFWQCREAALMSIEVWETLNGNLTLWSSSAINSKKLTLIQNGGKQLNAFYDRESLSFFESTKGKKTTFSGASTDVVSHEAGHAFLDVIRPDLWDSKLPETNAFHEAFGDCMAILTALFDKETRVALLKAAPKLDRANFVEALMEDLSNGVRLEYGSGNAAAAPRRAFNKFQWQLPTTLPTDGGPPSLLTAEAHSFGRVFSGCFYDVIRNIFTSMPAKNEVSLLAAAQTAGKLLIEGVKKPIDTPRFFQAVGRAMALADQALNSGANRIAIRDAFDRHNIALGANALLAPRASLAGIGPRRGAVGILSPATRSDLKQRIGAESASRLTVNMLETEGEPIAEAVHYREVSLTGLSEKLNGVVAITAEPTLVGNVGGRAALMSALPQSHTTTDEVHTFVKSLMRSDQIYFEEKKLSAKVGHGAVSATENASNAVSRVTHAVRTRGNKKVLERVRFSCRHHGV